MPRSRVIAITGASAGVGRATAIAFARRGDRVGLIARGERGLNGALREVQAVGGQGIVLPADVADHAALGAAADRLESAFGPIDIWVNNAMTTVFSPFHKITPDEFRRATEVTYLGMVHGTMEALRRMRPRRRGTIIQVGSALAYRAIPLQAPYCGAKHAIRGFTDAVRCELIHDRIPIQLTMVQMPALNTPQFDWARTHIPFHPRPVPPIFDPDLAAEAIVWAADHPRREVYVGGSTVAAIIGNKLAPGLLDRYLARVAYDGQHTDVRIPADRPDNLFTPVGGLHATRGSFGKQVAYGSTQFWATKHKKALCAAALVSLAGAIAGVCLVRRA